MSLHSVKSTGRVRKALVFMMLSSVLARNFCQVSAVLRRTTFESVCRTITTSSPKYEDNEVTYLQLKTMLSKHDIQLFDVRNPDEYQAGHISDAVNIPLGKLEESLKLSPEHFEQKFEVKAPGKDDDNIVFQCKSGNRSLKALGIAYQLGFSRARHYKGGYTEWVEKKGK